MQARCPLCRAEIAPGTGTLLKAGRKPLGLVHPHCASVVQRGVGFAGRIALQSASYVLAKRAPGLVATFRAVRQALDRRKGVVS